MANDASPGRAGRLVTFAVILAGLFGTSYAVGEWLPGHEHVDQTTDTAHDHSGMAGMDAVVMHLAAATSGMYEVEAVSADTDALTHRYRISHHGEAVAGFDRVHGALLHVVYVRPDLSEFHHVHPEIAADGTFDVDVPTDGPWHIVFESTPSSNDGEAVVLSTDIPAGDGTNFDEQPLPAAVSTATVEGADGTTLNVALTISMDGLRFDITTADGQPADGIEPYLEQPAHFVAFRQSDLAYAHLHPTSDIGDPTITYAGQLPAGATYRTFLQFGWAGDVITVPFTIET